MNIVEFGDARSLLNVDRVSVLCDCVIIADLMAVEKNRRVRCQDQRFDMRKILLPVRFVE
jgi:hypothetical protein